MPTKSKYLQLTDLAGDSTAILKSAVVGVEVGSYKVKRRIEREKVPEPEPTEPTEPMPMPIRIVAFPFRVAWGILEIMGRIGGYHDDDDDDDDDDEPKYRKVRLRCSIVHVRAGSRTRAIRVKNAYDEIMDQIGD